MLRGGQGEIDTLGVFEVVIGGCAAAANVFRHLALTTWYRSDRLSCSASCALVVGFKVTSLRKGGSTTISMLGFELHAPVQA
jgi:hypothetical protein